MVLGVKHRLSLHLAILLLGSLPYCNGISRHSPPSGIVSSDEQSQLHHVVARSPQVQFPGTNCPCNNCIRGCFRTPLSPTTQPPVRNQIVIDDLKKHELWLHILLQFVRPYESRKTTYRGDNNYVYILDREIYEPDDLSLPIIIPTMDEFPLDVRSFKRNCCGFNKLHNYPNGADVTSMFDPDVRQAYEELYKVYKDHPGAKGILKVAVNAKDHVNAYLHMNVLMHVLTYDAELYGYGLPAFYDVFPEYFTNKGCDAPSAECCKMDEYPRDLTHEEWKLSYYREDSGMNNFHGSWHYYNPHRLDHDHIHIPINHGELFYYFHNQMVARYNMERLSNGLELVKPLDDWSDFYEIPENYIPSVLTKPNHWSLTRCPNMPAGELGRRLNTSLSNLRQAINTKTLKLMNGKNPVNLTNDDGIKYVGCALENAPCGDIDVTLYGGPPRKTYGIHNNGHDVMSHIGCHNNTPKTEPPYGVMADTWSAIRDPIFFRWHKFNDDVFQLHKEKLPEYSYNTLALDDVTIMSAVVDSFGEEGHLLTYNSELKMTLWFSQSFESCIYQPTIDHHPFTYNIDVKNNYQNDVDVNVRIYLAPKTTTFKSNEYQTEYENQRTLWALMDRFNVTLTPGRNPITRKSCESSVTVPRYKSLLDLNDIYKDEEAFQKFRTKPSKCACGLPEHLLIPRGTPEGMPYQLFVYITRRSNVKDNSSHCPDLECSDLCSRDYTGCLHSDGEPMGFPFDRPLTTLDRHSKTVNINTIEELDNMLPNAMLHDIKISYDKDEKKFLTPMPRPCDSN